MNNPLADLILDHLERYPDLEPVDLYKLLHQAHLGPGHALAAPRLALDALQDEARTLDLEVREWEDVLEHLLPEPEIVRVHLRPYLRSGGDLERLHQAFVQSAETIDADDTSALDAAFATTLRVLAENPLEVPFELRDFQRLIAELKREGFPPRHHSEAYREYYEPAYRVVLLDALSEG